MSRTTIVGWIMGVLGLLSVVGVDLPLDAIEKLINTISDDSLEVFALVSGAIMVWLRKITDSPVAEGIKGWFGVKDAK